MPCIKLEKSYFAGFWVAVKGGDRADSVAKSTAGIVIDPNIKIPYADAKVIINK